ncbi:hypothetical protein Leryth_002494 [Lithospermum erythrorhizon]|nr:hypothetical protein Leryth_002494 [Lithospermum erythrorhizon]
MGMPRRRWLGIVRKKLFRSLPQETIIVLHTNNTTGSFSEATTTTRVSSDVVLHNSNDNNCGSNHAYFLTKEEIAAIKIQSCFRGHLARRAFRALKSLVKLQAVVRGVIVRRQARIALHCMHALARLQVTIRARQLLAQ